MTDDELASDIGGGAKKLRGWVCDKCREWNGGSWFGSRWLCERCGAQSKEKRGASPLDYEPPPDAGWPLPEPPK